MSDDHEGALERAERAEARLAELEVWSAELERRLADTTTALAAVQAAREDDSAELERLAGELSEAEAKLVLTSTQIKALNEQLQGPAGGR